MTAGAPARASVPEAPRTHGPGRVRNYDCRVRPELAAAHAAVDEAVAILREGRARTHMRIEKAAKDYLTDVDLASESAMQRSLAASTPEIGFYGEEGGGAALGSGKVWVADPLDGTVNYATGSPLCGVMLGLLEDGVPTLGVIDLPFLGVRVDSGAVADVGLVAQDGRHRGHHLGEPNHELDLAAAATCDVTFGPDALALPQNRVRR